jgi:hypothetical protein
LFSDGGINGNHLGVEPLQPLLNLFGHVFLLARLPLVLFLKGLQYLEVVFETSL